MEHEPDDERPLLRSTRLPPATAATLHSSLDDRDTRAQELREALEDLRADLEGRNRQAAPGSPARPAAPPAADAPAPPPADAPTAPQSGHGAAEPPVAPSAATPPSASPAAASPSTPPAAPDLPRSRGIRGRRVALRALMAVAVLVALTGVVRVVAWSVTDGRSGPPPDAASSVHASPVPSAPSSAPSSAHSAAPTNPRPSTSPTATRPQAGPAIPLPAGLPVSGPGADAPGAEFTAVVQPGGSLVVYERLVVRPGTASVRLAPAPAQGLPAALRGNGSTVTELRVAVDGRVVTPRTEDLGWRVTPPGGGPFTQVVVRYRLAGALVRATPAPPGRATLVLRPLTGPQAAGAQDPVVVRLHDARVGQVYCPSSPQPLCDTPSGAAHLATVPAGSSPIVLAQVTLP